MEDPPFFLEDDFFFFPPFLEAGREDAEEFSEERSRASSASKTLDTEVVAEEGEGESTRWRSKHEKETKTSQR